jgi:hypothetical protein
MIFDILRSKLYSNPILAICREISCNARDAHREVGTPDIPIHIHLPNINEPYYKVKDFGPGISPDRVSNIFIKYTASTKRQDNIQTGGFGIGCKTPFSYTDSFSITTNVDGTQYHYNCFIDETKIGKLALLHEAPTSEPNGTEIQVPVLSKNFYEFENYTEQACRHWDVKPIIKGSSINWKKVNYVLEGKKWAISTLSDEWHSSVKVIIDGIEYPLDLNVFKKYIDDSIKLINSCHGNIILYFGVGELSLSANREQIYLDERTQKIINDRLDDIIKEMKQKVSDSINVLTNLWEANKFYNKELKSIFTDLKFLDKLYWKNIELHNNNVSVDCRIFHFAKRKRFNSKLHRYITQDLVFEEYCDLYINDIQLSDPTTKHVKKAFDDNPKLYAINIICPTDNVTIEDLDSSINLNLMDPKKLSSITKASSRVYATPSSRLLVFKFDPTIVRFSLVSYASIEEDTNSKVLCSLSKENKYIPNSQVILKNKQTLGYNTILTLIKSNKNYSFYGIMNDIPKSRIEKDFSDMITIDDFIDKKILSKSTDYIAVKFAEAALANIDIRYDTNIHSDIKHIDSIFLKKYRLYLELQELCNKNKGLSDIYELINGDISEQDLKQFVIDNPELDIVKINNECQEKYPLIKYISYYNFKETIPHIIDYINMIDST